MIFPDVPLFSRFFMIFLAKLATVITVIALYFLALERGQQKAPCSGIRRRAWTGAAMIHGVSEKQMEDLYIYIFITCLEDILLSRFGIFGGFWR